MFHSKLYFKEAKYNKNQTITFIKLNAQNTNLIHLKTTIFL